MISVELAKRLKEAGFPQRGAGPIDPADISLDLKLRGGSVRLNSSLRCDKWSPAGFRLPRIAAAD